MKYALGLLLVVACAHTVPQDAATGRDGREKGAVPIVLENGEGIARGIVTYPGGDRVDWRSIQLPTGKAGTLDLEMTFSTPRPGLKVAFDVFDQYNHPIGVQRAVAKRSRNAKIDHATGLYRVRVFAPRRGDAGAYKLVATFAEDPPPLSTGTVSVMDPPVLPQVPPPVEECVTFDSHNPDCAAKCPDDAPASWKGCAKTCKTPDPNNPICQRTMACTLGQADRRIDACMANVTKYFQACNQSLPDPANPRCDHLDPVPSRIISIETAGDEVTITIAAGSNQRVEKGWKVTLLQGNSELPVVGGTATILRVEKTKAIAKLRLKREIVEANQNLRLTPP
ncbi:MAG: hypothetical protein ABI678_20085 [Kofleriaceae bacterium]